MIESVSNMINHAVPLENRHTERRCPNGHLLIRIDGKSSSWVSSWLGLLIFFSLSLSSALAHHRILPTFYWALLENRLILHGIKIGAELVSIRRKRTNVVSLLFTPAVDAEAVREVDILSVTLFLELCVLR